MASTFLLVCSSLSGSNVSWQSDGPDRQCDIVATRFVFLARVSMCGFSGWPVHSPVTHVSSTLASAHGTGAGIMGKLLHAAGGPEQVRGLFTGHIVGIFPMEYIAAWLLWCGAANTER